MASATVTAESQPPRRIQAPSPRVALVILAVVVLAVVLYLGRSALMPFVVGALLIYILDPAVGFLARRHFNLISIPRWLAVLIVYIITFFVVVEGMVLLLVPLINQVGQFAGDLPRIFEALEATFARLAEFYATLDLPQALREYIDALLADIGRAAPRFDIGDLLPIARTIAGTLAGLFGFIIIPVWAFYILRDRVRLTGRIYETLPPAWRRDVWAVLHIIDRVVGRWIRAQIVLGFIVGAATYVGLLLLGALVDERFAQFAILLAVIAGVLELLPIIGPIIAMVPTLLIALTTADPLVSLLSVVVLYTAVQQVENAVLVPKIQGEAVELHASVIIFALIVGGAIAGLAGAILSIPITAAARNVFRYLFRRLSEDDPTIPPADAPDLRPFIEDGPPAESSSDDAAVAETEGHGPNGDGTVGGADYTNRHLSPPGQSGDDVAQGKSNPEEGSEPGQ